MKLEDQVVSLELAKRLKELGINRDSLFYYLNIDGKGIYYIYFNESMPEDFEYLGDPISAFTVAELGEILPSHRIISTRYQNKSGWRCRDLFRCHPIQKDWIEVNAKGKMLVYLLENNV